MITKKIILFIFLDVLLALFPIYSLPVEAQEMKNKVQLASEELNCIIQNINSIYADDKKILERLELAQNAWIEYRDLNLNAKYPLDESVYSWTYYYCRNAENLRMINNRIKELQVWIEGVPEGDVCRGKVQRKPYK